MSSLTDFQQVPVIDVSGMYGDEEQQRAVAERLGRAARDVGFFYVVGHGVDSSLTDALLHAAETFFALPSEDKMKVYIGNSTNHRGYVPVGEEGSEAGKPVDLKEAFDSSLELPDDDPDYLAGNPMLGPNQWPDLSGFREAVTAYYTAVIAFGRVLLHGFAMALGEPADRFDHLVSRAPSQLRLVHYPYDPDAVDAQGIGAHTDFEVFTILKPTKPGLEVMNGAGEWIDVPPVEGAFVINIGDMLDIWSNGEFFSTLHRVRKVAEERYSFPLFFNVDYDTLVEPLERYVRPDGPNKGPLRAGEHLFAQTIHAFEYLKQRLARGEISLPEGSVAQGSFGPLANQKAAAAASAVA
jgi:isopenicillin N synthase-like dioxygenase